MAASLLRTKLSIPPLRTGLIARPRLIGQLEASLRPGHKLTLVSAPAGYGKTTLVAAWIEIIRTHPDACSFAWLSLDEHDDDLTRFLAYLVAALQTIDPTIGQTLQGLLHVPHLPPIESLLTSLINDLLGKQTATPSTPIVLVLDDLHAAAIPDLYPALEFWLDQAPPHVHTVLLTRQDPPLSLARWRVRGQLTELRQRDLRFSLEETTAFMERSMGVSLPAAEIAALEERTEGWIAGLQMAALALQDADPNEASAILAGFSGRHHFVLDYLTDEVLRRQPSRVRSFLLNTCILERMSGPLCDALLEQSGDSGEHPSWGAGDAQHILEHLERANLFVVPLDRERAWYRYHRLFVELLRARLRTACIGQIPDLHRRAAAWYEREGWGTQAVYHALKTCDAEWAAAIIERVLQQQTTISRLDGATLLAWLSALPRRQVRARPRLQILAARAYYVTGQRDRAESTLDDLERKLCEEPATCGTQALRDSIAADRASYAAMRGEVRVALEWAKPALAAVPADEGLARLRPASVLGLASLRAGNIYEAGHAFELAIAAAEQAGIPFAAVPLLCNLAEVRFVQGRLRQALEICDRADKRSTGASPTGFVHSMRAKIAYERGDLDAAAAHAQQALELLRQSHLTLGQETVYGLSARIEQARSNDKAADAALERARQIARGNDVPRLISLSAAVAARVRLAQGKIQAAERWADAYALSQGTEYLREFEDLTLARVELARGQPRAALDAIDRLLPSAQTAERWGPALEALALRALALHAERHSNPARSCLSQALKQASPEGYLRPFTESGRQMKTLLVQVLERPDSDLDTNYVHRLLAAFEPRQPSSPSLKTKITQPYTLVEPLTARELDVLGLLAQGLTNAEIGQQLVISLPTVKSHTRNLYGKLGVHSRRAAVVRARELGLLLD